MLPASERDIRSTLGHNHYTDVEARLAMGAPITLNNQEQRLLTLTTPLGKDVLIAESVKGTEGLSRDFRYEIYAFSETRHDLTPKDLVGAEISFVIRQESKDHEDSGERHIHGYVWEFETLGRGRAGQRSQYRLRIGSWLGFLAHGSNCRVFQDQSIPDVVQAILKPLQNIARADFSKVTMAHPEQRYLVQFHESNLNFMSRLLARAGIAYYITHEHDGHTVHFIDDGEQTPPLETGKLTLTSNTAAYDHLTAWRHQTAFGTGRWSQRTFNYKTPERPIEAQTEAPDEVCELPHTLDVEHYRYSGGYHAQADGINETKQLMARLLQRYDRVTGEGNYRFLKPGHHFTVQPIPDDSTFRDSNTPFTLSVVSLQAENAGADSTFSVQFEAIPKGKLLYPEDKQPVIPGPQTALVTGPAGSEIHTDDLGRIRVQFHWDREGVYDQQSSCWLRVMQSGMAGHQFGLHFLPRVGQEVVVAFENGNPDRPFVQGSFYHPNHKPPYADTPTRSGIKTRSTKSDAEDNYNELRFEDSKGEEEIFIQAERDFNVKIKHDEQRQVGNDCTTHIQGNANHAVDQNLNVQVKQNATHKIGDKLRVEAGNTIELAVGGSLITITGSKIDLGSASVAIDGNTVAISGKKLSLN